MSQAQQNHDWIDRLSKHRTGLAALSFAESTVVPIPLEVVVVPLMVGHPARALLIALWIWLGCLAGASLLYFAGLWAADPIVRPALEALGLLNDFEDLVDRLGREGLFWTVALISISPVPMQLAALGAGAANGNIAVFLAAIAVSRGVRYFGMAVLAQFVGERLAQLDIPKRFMVLGIAVTFAVIWGVLQLI